MSFEPEKRSAAAPGDRASVQLEETGGPSRGAVLSMSYAEGVQAFAPGGDAPPVQMLPGDTVPATGDLDRERPVGAAVPTDIRTRLITHIRRSARTAALLDEIGRHGGSSFGLVWDNLTGQVAATIHLDRRWTYAMWLPSMAHELSHLNDHLQGRQPDLATATDRAAFVAAKVGNEVKAHATQYAAQWELEAASAAGGYIPLGWDTFKTHLATLPGTPTAASVETAATTWLTTQYRSNPIFTTNNTGEDYYTYWGGIWDAAHPSTP